MDTTTIDAHYRRIAVAVRGLVQPANGKRVLLTGGTGTLGGYLTDRLLAEGYTVTCLNRDAHRQAVYQARFPAVKCYLADICDYDAMLNACLGQDIVIHAAALKRVDTGELAITEFARVNITGTQTVARAASEALVAQAVFISSDKAVQSLNFYGVTKAAGERIWLAYNVPGLTLFGAVRYGNVMGSNGSVLKLWRERLAKGLPIEVREPSTTRYFMRPSDAVDLVWLALNRMRGGDIFVPTTTPAFDLHDLARAVTDESNWKRTLLGPREKLHERLLAPGEYYEAVEDTNAVRVYPHYASQADMPDWACSLTAPRMTGAAVVAQLAEGA